MKVIGVNVVNIIGSQFCVTPEDGQKVFGNRNTCLEAIISAGMADGLVEC
jgi:hypothetical protein